MNQSGVCFAWPNCTSLTSGPWMHRLQLCRAAESIWHLFWDEGNAVAVAAKPVAVGDCSSPAATTALLLSSMCCDRREMGTGMLQQCLGFAPCQQSSFGTWQGRATVKCQQQWHRGLGTWAYFELSECSLELHLLKNSILESQAIHNLEYLCSNQVSGAASEDVRTTAGTYTHV